MYDHTDRRKAAAIAGDATTTYRRGRRVLAGAVLASVATLGFSLLGTGAASAAPSGGHFVSSERGSGSGSGGSGGNGGTWDQTKVPLPHLPGQAPVFVLQSQTIADVVALDQTSEAAADASMIAFYEDNTACTVDTHAKPDVQDTITCPDGIATTTDAFSGNTWIHVFRLVN